MKIALCNGENFKWEFAKFGADPPDSQMITSDTSCITKPTDTVCTIKSKKYNGKCSGAESGSCPTITLQALINAWIRSLKSSQK